MNFSSFTLINVTWYEYQIWDTQRERVNMISLQQDRPRHARQWIVAYHTWCLRSAPRQQLSASPYVFTPFNSARRFHWRSQWPSGLKRGSMAARLLGLWVRIPLGAWMSVSCQVLVSATNRSVVQRNPTDCDVSVCVTYKPRAWGSPGPRLAIVPKRKVLILYSN
jgi:hypothetical protein